MSDAEPPRPSAALLAELAGLRAVATRRPAREVAIVLGCSLALVAGLLVPYALRADAASPPALAAVAAALVAFVAQLWWALVPPRGQVLPLRTAPVARLVLVWLGVAAVLALSARRWSAVSLPLLL